MPSRDYSVLSASATEFSQMFQMLDNELGPESTQFAFDHFRQHSEEQSVVVKGREEKIRDDQIEVAMLA